MKKLAFTGIVLQPSAISFIAVISISIILFLGTVINIGGSSDFVYEIVLGPDSSLELLDSTKSTLSSISDLIFNNSLVNKLLFFSFWLLVGLIVYVMLSSASFGIGSAKDYADSVHLLNSRRDTLKKDFILRLILRSTALLAWVIYIVVFLKLFMPFSLTAFKASIGGELSFYNLYIGILGFVILALSLHLHVVLLRCFLLRPRTIGGWDDVIAARLT